MEIFKSSIFEERFVGTLGADPNGERERETERDREEEEEKKKKGVESDYLLLCTFIFAFMFSNPHLDGAKLEQVGS